MQILTSLSDFLLLATLLVIVLLVWAQIYGRSEDAKALAKNVNWVAGHVWTYLALFVVLIAAAIFILSKSANCPFGLSLARGFLALSFLMTATNVLLSIFLIIIKSYYKVPFGRPLVAGRIWVLTWVFWLIDAGLLSVSLAFSLPAYCFVIGFSIVVVLGAVSLCKMVKGAKKLRAEEERQKFFH